MPNERSLAAYMPVLIREFCPGDEAALFNVFRSSIQELTRDAYTPDQIQAWAPASLDQELWVSRMRGIQPYVAEVDGVIAAYADLQSNGYIDHFFVAGAYARQGLGSMLMNQILSKAISQEMPVLTSDVSRTAQSFFARFGFVVVEQRSPVLRGVVVPNALMRCDISARNSI